MTRKQICLATSLLFISSLLLATSSAAAGPDQHFGPFPSTSPDNGSCGNTWAVDTFDRFFHVHDNSDGSFRVTEQFKNGSFVTNLGPSPGACETDPRHGTILLPGMKGTFTGYLDVTVTGGTFNPGGCSTAPAACTTFSGFVAVTFPGGTVGCGPSGVCKFGFEYAAGDQGLSYHHWADVSDKDGSDLFRGDIANF
jgi:hypothetical protein